VEEGGWGADVWPAVLVCLKDKLSANVQKDRKVHTVLYFAASFFLILSTRFPCSFDILLFVSCRLRDCESGTLRFRWQRMCRSSKESKRIKI
jgi:hypothetical protein